MKFCVIYQQTSHNAQSPVRIVEQATGRGVSWINRYLDREYVRRLANTTLCTYAYNLLHFIRWWESVHYTGDIREGDLTESTLLEYVRFQSSQSPRPSPSIINDRVAVADRAIRNEFPDAPCQIARGFHQAFLQRKPMGLGRPRLAMSRLRVKVPKRNIVPLSVNEVSRFWSSFRTARDLAIVGLMLLQGLRSAAGIEGNDLRIVPGHEWKRAYPFAFCHTPQRARFRLQLLGCRLNCDPFQHCADLETHIQRGCFRDENLHMCELFRLEAALRYLHLVETREQQRDQKAAICSGRHRPCFPRRLARCFDLGTDNSRSARVLNIPN